MDFNRKKFSGVIETFPKNGSYAVSITSAEDRKEIAEWFEGCGSLTKKLFYSPIAGDIENRVYARANNTGTFPAGCGLREKCLISFSINEAGYVSVIVQATDAAKRTVEKQKVAVMAAKQAMVEDAEIFGVNVAIVQAAMFAKKYDLSFAEVNTAFAATTKKQQPKQQQNKSNQEQQDQQKDQQQQQQGQEGKQQDQQQQQQGQEGKQQDQQQGQKGQEKEKGQGEPQPEFFGDGDGNGDEE